MKIYNDLYTSIICADISHDISLEGSTSVDHETIPKLTNSPSWKWKMKENEMVYSMIASFTTGSFLRSVSTSILPLICTSVGNMRELEEVHPWNPYTGLGKSSKIRVDLPRKHQQLHQLVIGRMMQPKMYPISKQNNPNHNIPFLPWKWKMGVPPIISFL